MIDWKYLKMGSSRENVGGVDVGRAPHISIGITPLWNVSEEQISHGVQSAAATGEMCSIHLICLSAGQQCMAPRPVACD